MGHPDYMPDLKDCGIAAAVESIGERWSFLILRGALNGIRHFEDFQSTLGIARNILANRLARLVEHGIMDRRPLDSDRRKVEYLLTEKGRALLPVMLSLRQWGEKWGLEKPSAPVLADKRDRKPIQPISVRSHDDRRLELEDLVWIRPDADVQPLCTRPEDIALKPAGNCLPT